LFPQWRTVGMELDDPTQQPSAPYDGVGTKRNHTLDSDDSRDNAASKRVCVESFGRSMLDDSVPATQNATTDLPNEAQYNLCPPNIPPTGESTWYDPSLEFDLQSHIEPEEVSTFEAVSPAQSQHAETVSHPTGTKTQSMDPYFDFSPSYDTTIDQEGNVSQSEAVATGETDFTFMTPATSESSMAVMEDMKDGKCL
jgi:hypothetical protein